MEILNERQWLERLKAQSHSSRQSYKAMYSTWWDGIVTDPALMLLPIDDHQVHRGDAIFEAMKFAEGRVYLQAEHLERFNRSAKALSLTNPFSTEKMNSVLHETIKVSALTQGIVRLFLSRGPGTFSPSPYDTVGSQIYLVVTELKPMSQEKIEKGVSLKISKIPAKDSWQAQIKSCNYLPNVLMKKEAVDWGVDFTLALKDGRYLAEGSTENMILVDREGFLLRPKASGILAGTTMLRAFELASSLEKQGLIKGRAEKDLELSDLTSAKEIMMAGTTLDVLAVTQLEGKSVGSGHPGPVAKALRDLILKDQK